MQCMSCVQLTSFYTSQNNHGYSEASWQCLPEVAGGPGPHFQFPLIYPILFLPFPPIRPFGPFHPHFLPLLPFPFHIGHSVSAEFFGIYIDSSELAP